mgnify:CR=1 FL=1
MNPIIIDRKKFFSELKKNGLFVSFTQQQVDGIDSILDTYEHWCINGWIDNDLRKLAYVFSTSYHETGKKMYPVEEIGKGRGKKYGLPSKNGKVHYGRGDVQLTWDYNYINMGKIIGEDLYNYPELMLLDNISKSVMFEGMYIGKSYKGTFTSKSLEDYFTTKKEDPINARRIINGTDKAQLIAGYYWKFKSSLIFSVK